MSPSVHFLFTATRSADDARPPVQHLIIFLLKTPLQCVCQVVWWLRIPMLTEITTYVYQTVPVQMNTCWIVRPSVQICVPWAYLWKTQQKNAKLHAPLALLNRPQDTVWQGALEIRRLMVI